MYIVGLLRIKTLFYERHRDLKLLPLTGETFETTNVLIQFVSFHDSRREKRIFQINMFSFEMW